MIKRIWDVVSIVAVGNLLALLALVAVLAVSGGLRSDRLRDARDALAGHPNYITRVVEKASEAEAASLSAGQLITKEQAASQVAQLQMDQQMRELKDFQIQLDQARAALDARIAAFERDCRAWEARCEKDRALLAGEGFRKTLVLYESMSPDQAKDLFMALDEAEVVRVLSAMDERKASKIAKAFSSDAEKARLKAILDRLQKPATAGGTLRPTPVAAAGADAGKGETQPKVHGP